MKTTKLELKEIKEIKVKKWLVIYGITTGHHGCYFCNSIGAAVNYVNDDWGKKDTDDWEIYEIELPLRTPKS